jgi:hypothetical protein
MSAPRQYVSYKYSINGRVRSMLRQSVGAMVNFSLDFRARAAYTKRMEEEDVVDNFLGIVMTDEDMGVALVTEELLDAARNLLSAALPEGASSDMIDGFWEKVYDYL